MPFASIEVLIEEIKSGRTIILVDDERRENEGDLVMAAEKATPDAINFMVRLGRGLICVPMTDEKADALALPPQSPVNTAHLGTAFTVSVDAHEGITTGISAADRAATIVAIARPDCRPGDLARPGHIFPLRARPGGSLQRAGQTEGAVDLVRLAGLDPVGVICEILKDDGEMARLPDLEVFAEEHGLKIGSVEQIIEYRRKTERLVECQTSVKMPTFHGEFDLHLYHSDITGESHLALVLGGFTPGGKPCDEPVLVRVHSECLTGDVFGSLRCECGAQLSAAMRAVAHEGKGAVLYMRQEGRGIGLEAKLKAYSLQQNGFDTVEANEELGFAADLRDYGIGAQMLIDLGVRKMRLLTNNPRKVVGLAGYGLDIVERVPLEVGRDEANVNYLRTKKEKLGHLLGED